MEKLKANKKFRNQTKIKVKLAQVTSQQTQKFVAPPTAGRKYTIWLVIIN